MSEPLRICLVSSEVTPFAKTGGLGDVTAALARYLHQAGHDVRLFAPRYASLDPGGHQLLPVDFMSDCHLDMGHRRLRYGVDTTLLPYRSPAGAPLAPYFIHCPELYGGERLYRGDAEDALRFAFLARATLESCQRMGWAPHVFHLNDWHTALLPIYLRSTYSWDSLFADSRTALTIHNIGYQGIFPARLVDQLGLADGRDLLHQEDLAAGRLSFLKSGILHAGVLTTVSRTHARELTSERYGMGLDGVLRQRADHLVGIVNGIDAEEWDPATDPHLPAHYSADDLAGKAECKRALIDGLGLDGTGPEEDRVPLVGMVSRLTAQKGLDLCFETLPPLLERGLIQLAVLGSGEGRYEDFFQHLARRFHGRAGFYRGFSNPLAHLIEAGADLFLMPSRYEPCGLNQMYSQRYGTPPVVRRTGGLADTVEHFDPAAGSGTGFLFDHFTAEGLAWALGQALDCYRDRDAWARLVDNGMRRDFSWQTQIGRYVDLYRTLVDGRL